jgi:mono/diheme cytochrome c family protein
MSDTIRERPELVRSLGRWQTAGVVLMLLLVVAFPLYTLVEQSRRASARESEHAALLSSGRQLWGLNCATCHGEAGQGIDAPALNSQEFLGNVTDEQIHGIVAGGIPGTEMPSWWNEYGGPLTDQQIQAVVTYIRSWQRSAPSVPNWRNPSGSGG